MKLPLTIRVGRMAALAAAALALTGCGGEAQPSGGAEASTGGPAETGRPAQEGGGATEANPGVSGTIAAVTDDLLQVQDSEKQTAVSYSADTVITEQVAGSAADVVVGSCVTAMGQATDPQAGDDPADQGDDQGTFAAATVAVSPAQADGTCASVGAGRAQGGPGGWSEGEMPEGMPEGEMPTDRPSGMGPADPSWSGDQGEGGGRAPGAAMTANIAVGLVTAVDGDAVTVEQSGQLAFGGGQAEAQSPPAEDQSEPVSRSFTITDAEITVTRTADASSLEVGKCVMARGEVDDSGRVDAESLLVSTPGEQGCASAAGGRGAFQFGGSEGAGAPDGAGSRSGGPARDRSGGTTGADGAATGGGGTT
ncbi:MAG: hypothetical protein LBC97_10120 [Bifidobacteriaceae bacterium]|jgi:hypothetical protein|nr:hypothetical protein [Bifidobacteriaceae bacterium]